MLFDEMKNLFEHVNFAKSLFNMQLEHVFDLNRCKNMLFKNKRMKLSMFYERKREKTCSEIKKRVRSAPSALYLRSKRTDLCEQQHIF